MVWDEDDLNRQRVRRMLALPTEGDAVLIFDDTGFAKQGKCSVGVARQYSGTLGKTGNCQVSCQLPLRRADHRLAGRHPALPARALGRRSPTAGRRPRCPRRSTFQTKPQIALALLDQATRLGRAATPA